MLHEWGDGSMLSLEFWLLFILAVGGIGCTWVFCNMIVQQAFRPEARLKAIMAAFAPLVQKRNPPACDRGARVE